MTQLQSTPAGDVESSPLIERDELIDRLETAVKASVNGVGSLLVLAGEAGAGKSALVRDVLTPGVGSVWGYCEPLATPRPLGPFLDIARELWRADPSKCNAAVMRDELADWLGRDPVPLVIEDAHWIDDASADVLRFLGRRIAALGGLVVVTYRDELDADHPLRRVLGELATAPGVSRLDVPPLSEVAVARMVSATSINAGEAFRLTQGNPFLLVSVATWPFLTRLNPPSVAAHSALSRSS